MIQAITDFTPYLSFVRSFENDKNFSNPNFSTEEELEEHLIKTLTKPGREPIGSFDGDEVKGIFTLLVIPEESYIEVLACLSREAFAYDELISYIKNNYPGYEVDFVFNPGNYLLKERLSEQNAEFDIEQQKMNYTHAHPETSTEGIVEYSPEYKEGYFAIHRQDLYWTAEKVVKATERYHTYLAIEDGKVVGYIDVTYCFKENEPYDLFVKEEYRRKGYGRKLLAKALETNEDKEMMLLVDIDNVPALNLYESMGFVKAVNQNSITVFWNVGA